MNTGKAVAIFKDIESEDYSLEEKGTAVLTVMEMETKNSVTKADMEKVIKWFLATFYEIEADVREAERRRQEMIRTETEEAKALYRAYH